MNETKISLNKTCHSVVHCFLMYLVNTFTFIQIYSGNKSDIILQWFNPSVEIFKKRFFFIPNTYII